MATEFTREYTLFNPDPSLGTDTWILNAAGIFPSASGTATGAPTTSGLIISKNQPTSPLPGTIWIDLNSIPPQLKIYDNNTNQWNVSSGGGGTSTIVSATPPITREDSSQLEHGDLWYQDSTGNLYIRHEDNTSLQWVLISRPGALGGAGSPSISSQAPKNPSVGKLWINTSTNPPKLQVYTQNNTWTDVSGGIYSGNTYSGRLIKGAGWVDTSTNSPVLKIYDGNNWKSVSNWKRDGTTIKPLEDGDAVVITDNAGATKSSLTPDGNADFGGDVTAVNGSFSSNINAFEGTFTDDVNAKNGQFTDDVNAVNAVLSADVKLAGDIINTTTDGDQDVICNGAGLVKLTEYNLNPMEVVTKHDIGTAANEVVLHQHLGTMAYKDDLALHKGLSVAALPTAPTARVGNISRVIDGAASLNWGDTVTGGGAAQYLVWFNGTAWTVFGK